MIRLIPCIGVLALLGLAGPVQAQSAPLYPGVPGNPLDYGQFMPNRSPTPAGDRGPSNPYSGRPVQNLYTPAAPKSARPLSSGRYQDHEPLLRGLSELKLNETRVRRNDIVNLRRRMPPRELTTLIESVDGDRRVYYNAEQLTLRLQDGGLLHAGDRVVGYSDGKVYAVMGNWR